MCLVIFYVGYLADTFVLLWKFNFLTKRSSLDTKRYGNVVTINRFREISLN